MKATPANDNSKKKSEPSCPICGRLRLDKYRPFCSQRCADVDLHRWLSGSYAIPGSEERQEEGDDDDARDGR